MVARMYASQPVQPVLGSNVGHIRKQIGSAEMPILRPSIGEMGWPS